MGQKKLFDNNSGVRIVWLWWQILVLEGQTKITAWIILIVVNLNSRVTFTAKYWMTYVTQAPQKRKKDKGQVRSCGSQIDW